MHVNGKLLPMNMKQKLDENDSMQWTEISECM